MKKQKIKKKLNKIQPEQREAKARFIAQSERELAMAPQAPLGIESQSEFHTEAHAEVHKD